MNVYRQRGSLARCCGLCGSSRCEWLHIRKFVVFELKKGLVLITGAAGSGKSTTLACLIDAINHSHSGHIITIEDPIEVLHRHQKSIVSQREIGQDTDYIHALTAALRKHRM
ncbi:MAG: ATPase, T2SS/T4P/T4SS family [Merdibacter sp.]